jgi:O-acetyl-ADP-ribose deacetylase (regulator of RNase III)
MLTGRRASPSIDHFLSAAGGATWPGNGVALTRSGGRRWSQALSVPTGIWGLDALPATPDVFAVGVTALYETSDDGTSWRRRGEPAGGPLVEVSFSSPSNGVGLTTLGRLVATSDGGRSWRRDASAGRLQLTSSCVSGGGSYLVSDATGTIWSLSRSARLNRLFIPKLPSSVRPSNELRARRRQSVLAGLGGCEPGDAKATPGLALPARWIIHTVGPIWRGGEAGEPEVLASCYRRCLEVADSLGARSVAFPSISTGAYGFPADLAAGVAVSTLRSTSTAVRLVVLVDVYQRTLRRFQAALRA